MRLFTKINQEAYAFKKYGFLRDAIYLIKAEADPSSRWYLVFLYQESDILIQSLVNPN